MDRLIPAIPIAYGIELVHFSNISVFKLRLNGYKRLTILANQKTARCLSVYTMCKLKFSIRPRNSNPLYEAVPQRTPPVDSYSLRFVKANQIIAEWDQKITDSPVGITIDSAEIRERFQLGDFTGQLLVHVLGVKGHDIVKYALDTYSDNPLDLSCTHDSNAWPADFYAGIPAPKSDEKVIIWIQNSHPAPIPAGAVRINLMGHNNQAVSLNKEIPPFGSYPLSISDLLPNAIWPQQIELTAGKHFTRPRYEILKSFTDGTIKHRLAHANICLLYTSDAADE